MTETKNITERDNKVSLHVEVAYAKPNEYKIIELQVIKGTTILETVQQSGMLDSYLEINLNVTKLGIYGKVIIKASEQFIKDGDRVEIYRPLIADPKEVRKNRAKQAQLKKAMKK